MNTFRHFVFPILSSATLLAGGALVYVGIQSASESERLTIESLITNTERLAEEKIDRVERKLIDTENVLLDLMSGVDENTFLQRWDDYVGPAPFVKSVFLLGPNGKVLAQETNRKKKQEFFSLFSQKILSDLEIGRWPVDMLKHHHAQYHGRFYLFTYQTRLREGKAFTTVLEIDMDNILGDIFPKTFDALQKEFHLGVVDQEGDVIFGSFFAGGGPFVKTIQFPTTLYRWELSLAPIRAKEIMQASAEQRELRFRFLGFCALVLLFGLLGVGWLMQKERQLSALKTEFVSNVSHELKTPLSLIQMFAELLRFGPKYNAEKTSEYLTIIHRESEKLTLLIENILDFSRIERGKQKRVRQKVDLSCVVERAVETLEPRWKRDGHTLSLQIDPVPPILGDPDSLLLAVQNLLDNAEKFSKAPSTIIVEMKICANMIQIQIKDQGIGIPEEELAHIFERFFRGKQQGNRPVRGSGIGLSLVRSIVRQHQGSVEVQSELGVGTCFTLKFPLPSFRTKQQKIEVV